MLKCSSGPRKTIIQIYVKHALQNYVLLVAAFPNPCITHPESPVVSYMPDRRIYRIDSYFFTLVYIGSDKTVSMFLSLCRVI